MRALKEYPEELVGMAGGGCTKSLRMIRKVYNRKWLITAGAKVHAGKRQVVRDKRLSGEDRRGP